MKKHHEVEDNDDSDASSSSHTTSDAADHPQSYRHNARSRYYSDFNELGLLGRGGGGEVVKVRNRLDRQLYAVKKIKLDPEDPTMKKKILREVKTISRMQHRHIVRYFQAWIEGETGDSDSSSSDDDDDDGWSSDDDEEEEEEEEEVEEEEEETSESSASAPRHSSLELDMTTATTTAAAAAGEDQEDGDEGEDEDEEDDWLGTIGSSIGGMYSGSKHDSRRSNPFKSLHFSSSLQNVADDDGGFDWESLEEAQDDDEEDDEEDGAAAAAGAGARRKNKRANKRKAAATAAKPAIPVKRRSEKLYIQMEYCGGSALREVIDKGSLWKSPEKIWTLFRQILEAMAYIHRQGIIHRDIKVNNTQTQSHTELHICSHTHTHV